MTPPMKPLYVHAVGVAAPGLQGWAQARLVLAGAQPWQALPETPYAPQLLPPNERRRAPRPSGSGVDIWWASPLSP